MNNVNLSNNDINILKLIFKIFAVRYTEFLSKYCRSYVTVKVEDITITLMRNFIQSLNSSSVYTTLTTDLDKETVMIAMEPTFINAVLERLFGNNAKKLEIISWPFTDYEESIMEGVVVKMLISLRDTLIDEMDLRFRLKKFTTSKEALSLYTADLEGVKIAISIKTGKTKGRFKFFIPLETVLSIIYRLKLANTDAQKEYRKRLIKQKEKINQEINEFFSEMLPKPVIDKNEAVTAIRQWIIEGCQEITSKYNLISKIYNMIIEMRKTPYRMVLPLRSDNYSPANDFSPAGYRKAAVYLIGIGKQNAREVFMRLREYEIEVVTLEITRTASIMPEEFNAVTKKMGGRKYQGAFNMAGGMEYAKDVLESAFGKHIARKVINNMGPDFACIPFYFGQDKNLEFLLSCIENERPQTIAVILTYINPLKASFILDKLTPEIKSDVIIRMAEIDQRISIDVIREIERILERKYSKIPEEMRCSY